MHPGLLALAMGGLILAADAKNRAGKGEKKEKPNADEIADILARLERAETALSEAEANKIDPARLAKIEADRDELKKELAGLRAGKEAREKEPPAPAPKTEETEEDTEPPEPEPDE